MQLGVTENQQANLVAESHSTAGGGGPVRQPLLWNLTKICISQPACRRHRQPPTCRRHRQPPRKESATSWGVRCACGPLSMPSLQRPEPCEELAAPNSAFRAAVRTVGAAAARLASPESRKSRISFSCVSGDEDLSVDDASVRPLLLRTALALPRPSAAVERRRRAAMLAADDDDDDDDVRHLLAFVGRLVPAGLGGDPLLQPCLWRLRAEDLDEELGVHRRSLPCLPGCGRLSRCLPSESLDATVATGLR